MSERPEQLHVVRQWITKAEEDLKNAEYTLTLEQDCPLSTVCFHAQQCVEKHLKALLVYDSITFPKTHDLVRLFNLISAHRRLELRLEDLVVLNRYAIETRYPGDWDPIDRQEAVESVEIAQAVRATIRGLLPREVLKEK